MQTVTEADVLPQGFVCEGCGSLFSIGDNAYGVPIGITPDGDPIEEFV